GYKMDYERMLKQHVEQAADVTVGCLEVARADASGFGIVNIDEDDRIVSFVEKPKNPPAMPGNPNESLASMGIYVFNTEFLIDQLRRDADDCHSSRDFGKDLIPLHRQARQGGCAPLLALMRAHQRTIPCLLARCRHARRLLAGQYRSDQRGAGARSL